MTAPARVRSDARIIVLMPCSDVPGRSPWAQSATKSCWPAHDRGRSSCGRRSAGRCGSRPGRHDRLPSGAGAATPPPASMPLTPRRGSPFPLALGRSRLLGGLGLGARGLGLGLRCGLGLAALAFAALGLGAAFALPAAWDRSEAATAFWAASTPGPLRILDAFVATFGVVFLSAMCGSDKGKGVKIDRPHDSTLVRGRRGLPAKSWDDRHRHPYYRHNRRG